MWESVCVRNSVAKGACAFAIADRYVIDYHSGMGRFLAMKAGKLAALGAGQPASREKGRETNLRLGWRIF